MHACALALYECTYTSSTDATCPSGCSASRSRASLPFATYSSASKTADTCAAATRRSGTRQTAEFGVFGAPLSLEILARAHGNTRSATVHSNCAPLRRESAASWRTPRAKKTKLQIWAKAGLVALPVASNKREPDANLTILFAVVIHNLSSQQPHGTPPANRKTRAKRNGTPPGKVMVG